MKAAVMLKIGQLLGLLMLRKNISVQGNLVQSLLTGIAAVVAMSVVVAMLAGMLLIGGFYLLYQTLVNHGLEPSVAFLLIGLFITLAMAIFIIVIAMYVKRLKELPQHLVRTETPVIHRVTDVAESFVRGLMTPIHKP